MIRRLIQFIVLLLLIVTMNAFDRTANALPGVSGSSCINNADCTPPGSLICSYESGPDYRTCQSLSITVSAPTVTATSISTTVNQNGNQNMQVFGCLGSASVCQAQPLSNTDVWRSLGTTSGVNANFTATYSGLRPGRTYTLTIAGNEANSTAYAQVAAATTWPGTPPTPTDAHVACSGATGLCSRQITWNTNFPSDSRVIYGQNQPNWQLDPSVPNYPDNINDLATTSTGFFFAVGNNGLILRRDTNTWSIQSQGGGKNYLSVSSYDETKAWASGTDQILSRVVDGINWTVMSPPSGLSPTDDFPVVISTSASTALLLSVANSGNGTKVHYFSGTSWREVYNDTNRRCTTLDAISANEIWLGCDSGEVIHTRGAIVNGAWSIVSAASSPIKKIAANSPNYIFIGGNNGILRYSDNGGTNWLDLPNKPIASGNVDALALRGDKDLYFSQAGTIYHFLGFSNTPTWTADSSAGIVLGGTISSIVLSQKDRVYVTGVATKAAFYAMPNTSAVYTNITPVSGHSIQLDALAPNTTYHYWVTSTHSSGVSIGKYGGSFRTPIIDLAPPSVVINPIPSPTRTCPLTVSGTASDNVGIVSVAVQLDGAALSGVNGTTSWSVSIPCASLSNGTHTISVTANDGTNTSAPVTATFVFDGSDPTVTITPQGPVTTATVTVNGTAQDNDRVEAVDIAVNGGARTPVSITAGVNINWSATGIALTPGTNSIAVYATDRAGNEGSAATTIVYNQPTFTLSASTTSAQVNAGTSATFRLTATSVNTFAGTVSLASAGGPPSNSRSFAPASLTLVAGVTATTDLTVNTNGTDVGGPYTITVTATSGSITRTQTLTISVDVAADFSVSAAPSSQTVVAGGTAVYTISMAGSATYVMQQSGFTVTAGAGQCSGGTRQGQSCSVASDCTGGTFSCVGVLPAGVTSSWGTLTGDASHSGVASLTLSLHTTSTLPVANAVVNVVADDENGNIHTIQVQLTATPPPDFSLTFNSASSPVTAGPTTEATSTTFFNGTVTALNGYSGTVSLALDTVPADSAITATVSPATLTPSASGSPITVNIHVDSAVACAPTSGSTCTYTVRLIGTPSLGGVSQKTATANLVVTPDHTAPTITNPTASPDYNTVTITWQTSEPTDSQVTIYADAAHTNVVQTAFDATRCTGSCHSLALAPLNPVTTYYYSITSVDSAYPTGNSTTIYDNGTTLLQFTTTAAPDLTQPVFIFDQPGDGTEVIGTAQVAGHGSDNSPLDHLSLTITPSAGGAAIVDQQFPCSDVNCSFTYSWNTMQASPAFPNGDYVLSAWAVSTTGRVTPTVNYAESVRQSRVITVNNDTSAPQVLCLSGQTGTCQPQARNLVCSGGYCTITIVWRTDDLSTSEVEYGLSTNCSQYKVRPDGTSIPCTYTNSQRYDDLDPTNDNPVYRDHSVTLTNLLPDQLYHYRITSCNISNLCTN